MGAKLYGYTLSGAFPHISPWLCTLYLLNFPLFRENFPIVFKQFMEIITFEKKNIDVVINPLKKEQLGVTLVVVRRYIKCK